MIGYSKMYKSDKPWNTVLYVVISILSFAETSDLSKFTPKLAIGLLIAGLIPLRAALDPSTALNKKEEIEK